MRIERTEHGSVPLTAYRGVKRSATSTTGGIMFSSFMRHLCLGVLVLLAGSPALAENREPVTFRAIGGSVMGGTWNVAFTGLGNLLKKSYPGSSVNVLLGTALSNPLKLETNGGDVTCTQSFNIVNGMKGIEPFKKPLTQLASIANINDVTVIHILAGKSVEADSLEEIIAEKMPIRLDPGAKGTLHNVLGEWLLKEMGASYADIAGWGGKVMPVSSADRVSMMQDGTINVCIFLGSLQQAQLQELVTTAGVKWLSVKPETLEKIAGRAGIQTAVIPASLYNGAVGRDVLALADTVHMICRRDMPEDAVYKITKTLCENTGYMHQIQAAWATLKPETMPRGLVAPLHPGAERYYREAGLL